MLNLPPNSEIVYTADGSPTLSFSREDGYREKMHHAGGALSESIYIYLEALRAMPAPPRVLSVGLGLGYNELLTVAEMIFLRQENFKIWSFETIEGLREGFRTFDSVFDEVLGLVALSMKVPRDILQLKVTEALNDGRIELRGSFPEESEGVSANVVYYDAFSRKMNEALWVEESIVSSLKNIVRPDCVLTTYAATGSLNRSLRRLGFRLIDKTGFQGKRESTLAIRGLIR